VSVVKKNPDTESHFYFCSGITFVWQIAVFDGSLKLLGFIQLLTLSHRMRQYIMFSFFFCYKKHMMV